MSPFLVLRLLDRHGKKERLAQLLSLFLDTYPERLSQVGDAVRVEDADALRESSHTLKGLLSNLFGEHPFDEVLKLEAMALEGNLTSANNEHSKLEEKLEQLADQLRTCLQGLNA